MKPSEHWPGGLTRITMASGGLALWPWHLRQGRPERAGAADGRDDVGAYGNTPSDKAYATRPYGITRHTGLAPG